MSEQNGTSSFIFLTAVSRPYADLPSPYKLSDRLHAMRYRSLMRSSEGSRVQLFHGFHAGDQTPYPGFFHRASAHALGLTTWSYRRIKIPRRIGIYTSFDVWVRDRKREDSGDLGWINV